ncbi:hypothetical protein GCM10027404_33070 [Arthrobacter tumbae]
MSREAGPGTSLTSEARSLVREQAADETHLKCPRNTLGASSKDARETVTLVRYEE